MEPNRRNEAKENPPAMDAAENRGLSDTAGRSDPLEKPARSRRWLVVVILIGLAFGLGWAPMWLKAGRYAGERDSAQGQVRLLQLETLAAGAALDARRAEYEAARQAASQFFTELLRELDLGPRSALSVAQQNALKPVLTHRDHIITLLARGDLASAEKLAELYVTCRAALRGG